MKIGDKVVFLQGCVGEGFSYGMGDELNPATHVEVTTANIGHLQELAEARLLNIIEPESEQSIVTEEGKKSGETETKKQRKRK